MTAALKQALEALKAAAAYHGVWLMSEPAIDAWKFHRVGDKLAAAITAAESELSREQPARVGLTEAMYSMDEITEAAVYAEIPDGPFQSLLIGLDEAVKQRAHNITAAQEGK